VCAIKIILGYKSIAVAVAAATKIHAAYFQHLIQMA
jgi:hypothetical protein